MKATEVDAAYPVFTPANINTELALVVAALKAVFVVGALIS